MACKKETTQKARQNEYQTNMSQMKEQVKTSEKQLSKLEISNLHEKDYRIMIVKIIRNFREKKKKQG